MEYLNPSRVDEDAGRPGRTGRDPLEVLLGFAGMYDGAIPSTPSGVSREGNPAAREGIASAREGNIAREKRARGNAKPSASAHICESIPGFCQVNRNAKPICQTIGKEIFKVFSKNKNAKPICKTVGVALMRATNKQSFKLCKVETQDNQTLLKA